MTTQYFTSLSYQVITFGSLKRKGQRLLSTLLRH